MLGEFAEKFAGNFPEIRQAKMKSSTQLCSSEPWDQQFPGIKTCESVHPHRGRNPQNQDQKRGFRSRKTPLAPTSEKRHLDSKIPILPVVPCAEMGIVDSKRAYLGCRSGCSWTPKFAFPGSMDSCAVGCTGWTDSQIKTGIRQPHLQAFLLPNSGELCRQRQGD